MTTPETAAWLERALAVLALRLRHEVALVRALRGVDRQENFLGLLMTAEEADTVLAEASGRLRASGTAASAAELAALDEDLARQRKADPDAFWSRLAATCGLDETELDLTLLTAAPALDPRFGRVYGFLNDDLTRRYLTPALAVKLLNRHGTTVAHIRELLDEDAALRRSGIVTVGAERPVIEAPIRIDDLLLDRMLGQDGPPPAVVRHAAWLDLPAQEPMPALPAPSPAVWVLEAGSPSSSPGHSIIETGLALEEQLLLIDAQRLQHPDGTGLGSPPSTGYVDIALVRSLVREARLNAALPVLTGFDGAEASIREISRFLTPPAVVLSATPATWDEAGLTTGVAPGPQHTREELIGLLLGGHSADSPQLRSWLTGLTRLDLLTVARLLAHHRRPGPLRAAIRSRLAGPLATLAEPVATAHTLSDLVVPGRTREALRTIVSRQESAPTVQEQWGLHRVFGKGPGTIALFKGPSGTGKTMAASAVANALDLPLFRVNLAGLVSKYIGETEKNLDRLFEAASQADVVLFFDEADAMFGRRSEVQDAHDRYANLETAYLLQRLETYDGVALLASNLHQNIDDAFVRRLDLIIEFPAPDATARRAIWERIRTGNADLDDDLNFQLLADHFELTGGEIRNCCLAAAHDAASRGTPVGMETMVRAIGRELAKAGKPLRKSAFGDLYSAVRTRGEAP